MGRVGTGRDLQVAIAAFAAAIAVNAVAWSGVSDPWRLILYHFVFAFGICIVFPTWYIAATGRDLREIGISLDGWRRNALVGLVAAALTVPWRLATVHIPAFGSLATLAVAMCFSTLFEEIFFRGFLQTRFQESLGAVPAILLSSIAFATYHLGYGEEWRHMDAMIRMTLVGLLFGVAFYLTNNVITSFLLNLPHALVTFMERGDSFGPRAAITSLTVIVLTIVWLRILARRSLPAYEHADELNA
jgi:membrane protease YdiL (CAAX protease family)